MFFCLFLFTDVKKKRLLCLYVQFSIVSGSKSSLANVPLLSLTGVLCLAGQLIVAASLFYYEVCISFYVYLN